MFTTSASSRDRQSQTAYPFMLVRFPTLYLAFDMTQLQQVILMPPIHYSQAMQLGLAQVDLGSVNEPSFHHIIVIDLHRKLYGQSLEAPRYLLLFRANDGLLYGLPVETMPEIRPIAEELLIPAADRDGTPLVAGITRQVVKITDQAGEQILFIVDGNSLAQEVRRLAAGERDYP